MTDEEKIKLASQIAINFGIDFMDAKCRVEQACMNFGKEFNMSTETSDKNVAKAKILIEEFNTYNDLDGIQDLKQYIIAIQNLLSEREKDKKKIQELEKKYLHEKLAKEEVEELLECSVPKLRIKDIKEKIKLDSTIVGGRRNAKTLEYGIKLGKIKVCEELLEEGD